MRPFLPLLFALSLGLVLTATSCETGEPTCDSRTCGGCCTDDGRCEVGSSPRACGLIGAVCSSCGDFESCFEGRCVALVMTDSGTSNDAGSDAGSVTDAGSDAGTGSGNDAGMTDGGSDAGTTDAGSPPEKACTLSTPQPTVCSYGEFCNSNAICQSVPTPTCENLRKSTHTWNPATSSGPVIHAAELVSFANDTFYCPDTAPMRVRTRIRAYSLSGNLPTTATDLSSVFRYVRVDGTPFSSPDLYSNLVLSADRKNLEFQVSLCVTVQQTALSMGFYFQGGNGFCALATR